MDVFKIGVRSVGVGRPCFIIAEAGVNHNGRLDLALKLVDAAKSVGADAVKFQTFDAEALATADVSKAAYQKGRSGGKTQLDMLKELMLKREDFIALSNHCKKKGIIFLSTPFDFGSADFLNGIGVPAFKLSSGDLNNYPFLVHIATFGKPLIISTGMAEMSEIKKVLKIVQEAGRKNVAFLQCTTAYPAPIEQTNIRAMVTIREELQTLVGFSDHTSGFEAAAAAVALGACIIEKHFTLDRSMEGPDHVASLDPKGFAELVRVIRNVELALGSSEKTIAPIEKGLRNVVRKHLVAAEDIQRGTIFSADNVCIKRSEAGLEPEILTIIIGKKAKRQIGKDKPIEEADVA